MSQMADQARAYLSFLGFCSTKRPGVFLLSSLWMGWLSIFRITPSNKLASTLLYTWVERDQVREKYLPQEHDTVNVPVQGSKLDHLRWAHLP